MHNFRNNEEPFSFLISEDFISHGPVVTFDVLSYKGLLLTVTESFEFVRYPRSETESIQHFSLFSDRNVNTLTLYLSWPVSRHWELDLFANYDKNRDAKEDRSSSFTTLFTLECRYVF